MHVDPSGRNDGAIRVDDLCTGGIDPSAYGNDRTARYRQVTRYGRTAFTVDKGATANEEIDPVQGVLR
jgi:hypothetical protein